MLMFPVASRDLGPYQPRMGRGTRGPMKSVAWYCPSKGRHSRVFEATHHPEDGCVSYCGLFPGVLERVCRRQVRWDARRGTWKPVSPFRGFR